MNYSRANYYKTTTHLPTPPHDLVIIGGGIHGAGVAQAAAAAGYSCLVLEQSALACGTSSRSSKLIHGGLRYLESHQFALVRECLHERSLLLKLAPDLVELKPFHIPIYPNTRRRPWQLYAGLSLYAVLAGFGPGAAFKTLKRRQWDTLDGLDCTQLQQVFQYHDAQTDDAALTRAVMHSAQNLGAELLLPARMIHAETDAEGVEIEYEHAGVQGSCRARMLINASGPWANEVLQHITPPPSSLAMSLVQGTHIIIDQPLTQGMYYVEAPSDGRAVFVMPWHDNTTMVGTTEHVYHGDPAQVQPLAEEVDYLWQTLGHYFPAYRHAERSLIKQQFAGLRVLPQLPGAAFSRPRDTMFHADQPSSPRVMTIYGGKLTAYRATAENLVKQIAPHLPARTAKANTRALPLSPV